MHPRATALVTELGLQPHPEGGHYREVFRSARRVAPGDDRGDRSALTVIHFLLASGEQSRWHRVRSDEAWHLVEGGPLELLIVDPECRELARHVLSTTGPTTGPAAVVPAGHWQAARPLGPFALAGCTVGPGFEFGDFTMLADEPATAERLRQRWPEQASLV